MPFRERFYGVVVNWATAMLHLTNNPAGLPTFLGTKLSEITAEKLSHGKMTVMISGIINWSLSYCLLLDPSSKCDMEHYSVVHTVCESTATTLRHEISLAIEVSKTESID